MPNTFYFDACNVDSRMTPFPPETKNLHPEPNHPDFFVADKGEDGKLMLPHSIMNDNVAINYRTIYNVFMNNHKYLYKFVKLFLFYGRFNKIFSVDS